LSVVISLGAGLAPAAEVLAGSGGQGKDAALPQPALDAASHAAVVTKR